MKKILLLSFFLFLNASTVKAADQSSGCGLGWYLFQKNSLVSSTLRATTNGLFFNNTFGMTFGTSNCAKHDIVRKDKQEIYFTESNKEVLALEMAQGKGEYLTGFARTLGCNDQSLSEFNKATQQNYEKIFNSNDVSPAEMLKNVKDVIHSNPSLSKNCHTAII